MSFSASFDSNINCPFSWPCLGYINMKTSVWDTKVGPHSNNVEILPIKLTKEGFIK